MAAFRHFPGKPQAWLETELDKVLADLAAGKTVQSYTAGDSSGSELVSISIMRRKEMILSDLNKIAPDTYPRATTQPARITRPSYL